MRAINRNRRLDRRRVIEDVLPGLVGRRGLPHRPIDGKQQALCHRFLCDSLELHGLGKFHCDKKEQLSSLTAIFGQQARSVTERITIH
jgi:hypothetical protein